MHSIGVQLDVLGVIRRILFSVYGYLLRVSGNILKYAIVCEQVESCTVADFYQELVKAGVNIEFTKQVDVRATTKEFERALRDAGKIK